MIWMDRVSVPRCLVPILVGIVLQFSAQQALFESESNYICANWEGDYMKKQAKTTKFVNVSILFT